MSDERDRGPLSFDEDDDLEFDRGEPPEEPPPPARPATGRYGWFIGVLIVLALAYITLNTLRTEGTGSRGVPRDDPLPPFAVPLALGGLEGDANVATHAGEGERGGRPACEVRGPQILNVCELSERGPVVLAFLGTRGGKCERQLDLLERVRRSPEARGIQFAGVAIRGGRGELRDDIRRRGWRFPVGHDRDGLVANLYGVSVCPTITFAYPGGIAMQTTLGLLGERELQREVRDLATASRERGWTPPPRP